MSEPRRLAAGDIRNPPLSPAAARELLRAKGSRASRLDAIAVLRLQYDAAVATMLRNVAVDPKDDPVVRACAIAALAVRGERVTTEPEPPPSVRAAQIKAGDILRWRQMVADFDHGTPAAPLRVPMLLPAPATGSPVQTAQPSPQLQARIAAALSLPSHGGSLALQVVMLRCGNIELAAAADTARLNPAALLRAPARPAQLAVHHTQESDYWAASFDIVTEPANGGMRIAVLDLRGRVRFAGTGTGDAHGIAFTLQAADIAGTMPVVLRGRVVPGAFGIDSAISGTRGTARRAPQPFSGPARGQPD